MWCLADAMPVDTLGCAPCPRQLSNCLPCLLHFPCAGAGGPPRSAVADQPARPPCAQHRGWRDVAVQHPRGPQAPLLQPGQHPQPRPPHAPAPAITGHHPQPGHRLRHAGQLQLRALPGSSSVHPPQVSNARRRSNPLLCDANCMPRQAVGTLGHHCCHSMLSLHASHAPALHALRIPPPPAAACTFST
jgi:hypothetical protein